MSFQRVKNSIKQYPLYYYGSPTYMKKYNFVLHIQIFEIMPYDFTVVHFDQIVPNVGMTRFYCSQNYRGFAVLHNGVGFQNAYIQSSADPEGGGGDRGSGPPPPEICQRWGLVQRLDVQERGSNGCFHFIIINFFSGSLRSPVLYKLITYIWDQCVSPSIYTYFQVQYSVILSL